MRRIILIGAKSYLILALYHGITHIYMLIIRNKTVAKINQVNVDINRLISPGCSDLDNFVTNGKHNSSYVNAPYRFIALLVLDFHIVCYQKKNIFSFLGLQHI